MAVNQYIHIFKQKIEAEVNERKQENATLAFIENLYDVIGKEVKIIAAMLNYPAVNDVTLKNYFDTATIEYISVNPIRIEPLSSLTKPGFKTWLTKIRNNEIEWNYTNRYITLLEQSGRSKNVVDEVFDSSYEIISKIGDPKSKHEFYVKGLVVGEVQSGKTGNFNGVINRAIDSGYDLIIVLSGIMEDLRSQTQQRIESDVIGEGTDEKKGAVGVGSIQRFGKYSVQKIEQVVSVTSYKSDFNLGNMETTPSLNSTNILVCKKNISVLKNLIVWLHDSLESGEDQHSISLLIIDDEADNASLNNEGSKGHAYASKINKSIRTLLHLFHKKSYVGYTATPFANVLQDRNEFFEKDWEIPYGPRKDIKIKKLQQVANIFPDDFIVLLNTPTNYVGAKQIFETVTVMDNQKEGDKLPMVINVDDYLSNFPSKVTKVGVDGVESFATKAEWDKKIGEFGTYLDFSDFNDYKRNTRASKSGDGFPHKLPASLEDAILCFVLALAIRESRKSAMITSVMYQPHNTMLIHISRFTAWQNKTSSLASKYLNTIISAIENDSITSNDSIYFKLKTIWNSHYATIVESIHRYLPPGYQDKFMVPIAFSSLKDYLPEAIKGIEVAAINSVTGYDLKYIKGKSKKIIAIGGNRLSRGFTLEGLTINYFIRSTNYSDTLLQMGRWFGYRPGYLDCCKLFTTAEAVDKFDSTTRCIEELEGELKRMDALGKSPEQFILRVKKHPGTLKITRPSILKNAKIVKWSYQDQLIMSTTFDVKPEKIRNVWKEFKKYIAPKFKTLDPSNKGFITFATNAAGIIDILEKDNNLEELERKNIIKFILLCNDKNKLQNWTVALKCTGLANDIEGKGRLHKEESNLPIDITMSIRRGPKVKLGDTFRERFLKNNEFKATGKSANIMSSSEDMNLRLGLKTIESAKENFIKDRAKKLIFNDKSLSSEEAIIKAKLSPRFPERIYRERMSENEGLLIIYLFDSHYSFNQEKDKGNDELFSDYVSEHKHDLNIPLVGYALGFPPIENDPGGEYMQGDYDLNIDENIDDEDYDEEDSSLPDDSRDI